MKDKADINRIEGKGFLSNYPVGTYRLLYDKNCYCLLIYSNVFLQIQNDQNINASSVIVTNCRQNVLTLHFIPPTFFVVDVLIL